LADRPHDSLSPLKPPRKKAGREVHFEDEAQDEDSQDEVQPLTVTYLESLSAKDRFQALLTELRSHLQEGEDFLKMMTLLCNILHS
jgi:hypothetical protein